MATIKKTAKKMQMGGGIKPMMKKGGSFPDLNKDGKITKADILKGRGVIAKKGMKVKKAQGGLSLLSKKQSDKQMNEAPVRKGASRTPILGLRKEIVNEGIKNADVMDSKFDPIKMQKLRADAAKKSYYKKGGVIKKTMKVKKAQNGDSTKYYYNQSTKDIMNATKTIKEKGSSSKEGVDAFKKQTESLGNLRRQSKKGKPGYDKMGNSVKKNKMGGKTKKCMTGCK